MNRVAEVIVVGGGVTGCAVAYELAKRSVSVLLLDKSLPGRATSASAGGLWPIGEAVGLGCGVIYHAAQSNGEWGNGSHPALLPAAFRDFLVASSARFPALAVELCELSGIDIEYAPGIGLIFVAYDEAEWAFVQRVALTLPAGTSLEMLSAAEAIRLEPRLTPELRGAALLPGEHQVNPMLLAEAYKRAALRQGAAFRHDVRVTALRRRGDRVTGVAIGDEFVPCRTVVNAAGAWAGELAATVGLELPVAPVRGQIVLTETLPPLLNGCLSTSHCYLAQKLHGEVLIGSTTEHAGFDVSVTPEAIRSLCAGAVRVVPCLQQVRIKRTWAGLRPGTPDELPILGHVSELGGYINAAGGFRTGIVAAPLTGEVVAQVIAGEHTSCPIEPFLMERFQPRRGIAGEARKSAALPA
ncbi:MAG TPA: FAD-dependent oxidoreductase [Gemmataceae bacterium]|nr:FAD-dependent oxidoreductase [Gemmataceae bacterium]